MKQYTGNIYQCDFCGKKSAWKHVITNHEKICKKKPENKHKCFQYCNHLEKIQDPCEENNYDNTIDFYCNVTQDFMYSYKLERWNIKCKEKMQGLKRMPIKCEHYSCSGGNSGDYIPPTS